MFASICSIRADKQEQLDSSSVNSTTPQNGTQKGTLDLDFYLGIYGGETHGCISQWPNGAKLLVSDLAKCAAALYLTRGD